MEDRMFFEGIYEVEHWHNDRLLRKFSGHNGIKDEGKKDLLDMYFSSGGTPNDWYVGLVDDGFTPADATDVLTTMSGNEFTDYTDANNGDSATTRPLWDVGLSGKVGANIEITNDAGTPYMIYDITNTGTVQGILICTQQTKASYVGILWSTADFTSSIAVTSGDTLKVAYTVRTPAA